MNTRDRMPSQEPLSLEEGALPGATRDRQSVTRDWQPQIDVIAGVTV